MKLDDEVQEKKHEKQYKKPKMTAGQIRKKIPTSFVIKCVAFR